MGTEPEQHEDAQYNDHMRARTAKARLHNYAMHMVIIDSMMVTALIVGETQLQVTPLDNRAPYLSLSPDIPFWILRARHGGPLCYGVFATRVDWTSKGPSQSKFAVLIHVD